MSYFFEEACSFQERGLRAQAIQGLQNLVTRVNPSVSKDLVMQLLERLKSNASKEKRFAATKLLPKIAEVGKNSEDLYKHVKIK